MEIVQNYLILYLLLFLFTTSLSFLLYPFAKKIALKFRILDNPHKEDRKIHTKIVPRTGSVMMVVSFFVSLALVFLLYPSFRNIVIGKRIYILFFGVFFLTFIGFLDDKYQLNPYVRLGFQFLIGVGFAYFGFAVDKISFGKYVWKFPYLKYILTPLWLSIIINAINFIDGMDGLASGISIVSLFFLFLIGFVRGNILLSIVSIVALSSVLGFWIFNFPPAKIFMGDGGSYFIGSVYTILSLVTGLKSVAGLTILIPLIVSLLPILDLLYVVVRRVKQRKNPFFPDKNHFHHRLMSIGFSPKEINFIFYGINFILGVIAFIVALNYSGNSFFYFVLALVVVYTIFFVVRFFEKRNK